ncbi:hypothetical protein CSC43_2617 [Pseudomonas aeruginosa]|nr:hypothetical protein CSC43_2617 [Pseudomonas aeruginosa]
MPSGAPNTSAPDGCRTQNSKGRRGLRHGASDTLPNTP